MKRLQVIVECLKVVAKRFSVVGNDFNPFLTRSLFNTVSKPYVTTSSFIHHHHHLRPVTFARLLGGSTVQYSKSPLPKCLSGSLRVGLNIKTLGNVVEQGFQIVGREESL